MKRTKQEGRVTASEGELQVELGVNQEQQEKAAVEGTAEVETGTGTDTETKAETETGTGTDTETEAENTRPVCTVTFPLAAPDAGLLARLVEQLGSRPLELAELLQGGQPASAAALLPAEPPWAQAPGGTASGAPAGACSCAASGCAHVAAAAKLAAAQWKAAPQLRLAALGLAPQRLQGAVFAAWAADAPAGASDLPAAAARRSDAGSRAERQGPALAEWLAEAAEQDRLHVPGPQFHDVKISLTSEEEQPAPAADAQAWAELLPGIPGAAAGVRRIEARLMERTREQGRRLSAVRQSSSP
ncbi:hypothetical protein [Paenibacillus sp. YPG26]|uniref:hypothetical protein n=1 Tax=Paenibacillus sp. YPG26 TaxID=2878915 RepID=UPI002040887D|nr:hypothetical protein [Paenibacillus sp. YPG26]USB33747.1 hypothetical protein LDO05_02665 [Paenibacillus sp. YPG26]